MDRLLVIVSRAEPQRYENFVRLFSGEPVDVILDRRVGERRVHHLSSLCERRRGDRRVQVHGEVRMRIDRDTDVISTRQKGRELTAAAGLSPTDSTVVATVVSELARNIVSNAQVGEIILRVIESKHVSGIEVVVVAGQPGIMDIARALRTGDPTPGGLPGVRSLADAFFVTSEVGKGTAITIRRWRRQ